MKENILTVREAKALAAQWVRKEAGNLPGFYGAYFAGSTNWMLDDAPFPQTPDLDIKVVLDGPPPAKPLGNIFYGKVMLGIGYISRERLQSAETSLGDYPAAAHFTTPNVIAEFSKERHYGFYR